MSSAWTLSNRSADDVRPLADRHYNRQKIGAKGFAPPGRALVLKLGDPVLAFWITSWPFAEFVKHAWAGAWVCSAFRNETPVRSSLLIREAVAASRWYYGEPPALGMITFVDAGKIRNGKASGREVGRCYRKAGFRHVGFTKAGLWCFQILADEMPPAKKPDGATEPHKDGR